MEGAPLAVSDTGPLIALHTVGLLSVLCAKFREVFVPLTVWSELTALPNAPEPAAVGALRCIRLVPDIEVPTSLAQLDPGERQAIARALAVRGTYVLTDDGDGRRIARGLNLPHIGTIGLIAIAKHVGLCEHARDAYARLLSTRFRIDMRIVNDMLSELGEDSIDT